MTEKEELELFRRYISAAMEPGDKETLKDLLKNDEQAGLRFAEFIEDTSLYVSVAEELDMKDCAVKIEEAKTFQQNASLKVKKNRLKKVRSGKSKTATRVLLSIAAAFVISGVLFFKYLKDFKNVGHLDIAAVSLERGGFDFTWGEKNLILDGDSLTAIDETTVHLRDGSSLHMEKGAVCKIVSTQKGLLVEQKSGRVDYKVSKQSEGSNFRVLTRRLRTTVIGTQFTVDADNTGSKVRVKEGLVKVDDLIMKSFYVNPGEFAEIGEDGSLIKKSAAKTMLLEGMLKDSQGNDFTAESLENKKYILLLYASSWDPASRTFIHSFKEYYQNRKADFEVIYVNDANNFAADYEMPWASVKADMKEAAEEVLGTQKSSYPLNLILMDQSGNIISRSSRNGEWLSTELVLETLENNLR